MARLIPAFADDRTPPGERDVFTMFKGGPDTWVVLHSLDLAPWNRGLRTEIDFVAIVPDVGIVCIEVKSHEEISFEDDRWMPVQIKRSPFKQACDGRYMFHRRLREIAPHFSNLPVVHCCIFPRATFDLRANLSIQPWELIDGRSFKSFRSAADFCAGLRDRMLSSIAADTNLQKMSVALSKIQIEQIVDLCFPVRKHRPDAREEIRQREKEIESVLREQQKPVLQLAALNHRLIVSGAAGTGKTLIAIEVALRAAEQGQRVALLCFNQLVGNWITHRVTEGEACVPNLVVGRAVRVMAELTGVQIPASPAKEYWDEILPGLLEERLTDPDFRAVATFDYLVLDEAQDLLARPRLWSCLSQFLKDGPEKGRFVLFGDFDHQVLGERKLMAETLDVLDASAKPSRWLLSENCRNYRIIGDTAVLLSGFPDSVYSGYMRSGGGLQNYDITYYADDIEQLTQIKRWLSEFRTAGYKASEIVVLSFCADDLSAAARLANEGVRLLPAWQYGDGTCFSSIHAFKGMERKVVILTDLAAGKAEFYRHLFYTGMTRATESVRILCDKKFRSSLSGWFSGKDTV